MDIKFARPDVEIAIKQLLAECGLPFEDFTTWHLQHTITLLDAGQLIGMVGLEVFGDQALLRSLAVQPAYRGRGCATRLVNEIEAYAQEQRITTLFLLTTTAEGFFARRGYRRTDRQTVPVRIASTTEFQGLCPDSAVCMLKELAPINTDPRETQKSAQEIAAEIAAQMRSLAVRNTPNERAVRRKYSQKLRQAPSEFIHAVAQELLKNYDLRWVAYELIADHKAAFRSLEDAQLEAYGRGIDSWWTVDSFARTLAGPAWLKGQVSDKLIHNWACSEERWWRRAALVSTVALNMRSRGGPGDVPRTLAVCRLLAEDQDDMVVKAMSWALRELVVHDPQAVRTFLSDNQSILAARVKREVTHKLETGLKNPGR
jgi:N-acetylglutamate synthase-like GNAT family acetyltransferase/3-methyladenine DNA glycosylase AlkD